jgi:hypothetical protein
MAEMSAQEEEMAHREMLLAQKCEEEKRRCLAQEEANLAACTRDNLRCPVAVILGRHRKDEAPQQDSQDKRKGGGGGGDHPADMGNLLRKEVVPCPDCKAEQDGRVRTDPARDAHD